MPKTPSPSAPPPTSIAASPTESVESTLAALKKVIGPKATITVNQPLRPAAVPPPLDPKITGPIETIAARHFPGVPLLPLMSTGGTDGIYLQSVGIPVYGVPGIFRDPDGSGVHGLNERIPVKSLYEGRDYLYDLVKLYAGGK